MGLCDEDYVRVLELILQRWEAHHQKHTGAPNEEGEPSMPPLVVALAGVAGSGKSTVCDEIIKRLNKTSSSLNAVSIPMDGYHLYRSELQAMSNAEEAAARRGAPFTFAPCKLAADIQALKKRGTFDFPGFDHSLKDPQPEQYPIRQQNSIVLIEGLYMTYKDGKEWDQVFHSCDVHIFLDCSLEVSTERLVRRHMKVWSIPETVARERATGSDYLNSQLVAKTAPNADLVVCSVDMEHLVEY